MRLRSSISLKPFPAPLVSSSLSRSASILTAILLLLDLFFDPANHGILLSTALSSLLLMRLILNIISSPFGAVSAVAVRPAASVPSVKPSDPSRFSIRSTLILSGASIKNLALVGVWDISLIITISSISTSGFFFSRTTHSVSLRPISSRPRLLRFLRSFGAETLYNSLLDILISSGALNTSFTSSPVICLIYISVPPIITLSPSPRVWMSSLSCLTSLLSTSAVFLTSLAAVFSAEVNNSRDVASSAVRMYCASLSILFLVSGSFMRL